MLNSKLIDIFSCLSKKEMKLLSKFINSPVYNKHKDVTALFEYIFGLEKFTEENLSKKEIFKHLFPKSNYDDLRLRHVVSYLLRVCEDCMAFIEMNTKENQLHLNLLRAYRKRALDKHFINDLQLLKKGERDTAKRSSASYLFSAQINEEAFQETIDKGTPELNWIQESDKALTLYFVLSKLKNGCKQLAFFKEEAAKKQFFISEIKTILKEEDFLRFPEIELFFLAYCAFENFWDVSYYQKFKERLCTNSLRIDLQELKDLYALSIAYCKRKLLNQNKEFERELFEIYLHGLACEALLNNQILGFETQKSIVDIALRLNEIRWVEDFISDSKQITDKNLQDEVFQLNCAKVCFAKSNFKACIQVLSEVKTRNIVVIIDSQLLKISALKKLGENYQAKIETQKLKEIRLKNKL